LYYDLNYKVLFYFADIPAKSNCVTREKRHGNVACPGCLVA